ncbi:MAG TPA: DUF2721 domain-containing protein [Burkholderiales bacterium]|nr:DUF2721 domain-containing protein [Burkholderiales bacterium]
MLPQALDATALSHAIQNAVVPVFLLTGIGAMLAVLANRLGRIVDFARILEGRLSASSEKERVDTHKQLTVLSRRARLIYAAISLSVLCALLICTVIVLLFVEVFLSLKIPGLIGVLFIVAMLAFIIALICFLREVYVATVTLRIGSH